MEKICQLRWGDRTVAPGYAGVWGSAPADAAAAAAHRYRSHLAAMLGDGGAPDDRACTDALRQRPRAPDLAGGSIEPQEGVAAVL